jgi:hypothetical protein
MKRKSLAVVSLLSAFVMVGVSLAPANVSAETGEDKDKPQIQIVTGDNLPANAISVEEIEQEGDRMVLRVRNRTPFIVIIYIHGHRIGWLRPFRTGRLRGLRRGFHRLYAHSRWGSFYWGPRSVWVPGTWSLYR